jgi:hypothetical protein
MGNQDFDDIRVAQRISKNGLESGVFVGFLGK